MKGTLATVVAFAGLAAAQQMNIAAVNAAPPPATTVAPVGASGQSTIAYNTATAASSISADAEPTTAPSPASKEKRSACQYQGSGSFPMVRMPDSDTSFQNSPYFTALAYANAVAPYPYATKFVNLNGSTQQNSYLTYYVLNSYDVNKCASYCNNVDLCSAFNIYVERDPQYEPAANCPNPSSITVYKCALWGSSISAATATNTGQYRNNFHVVIAASNGYDKTAGFPAATVPSFTAAVNLTSQAITQAAQYFLGSEFFAGPYDPHLCGFYATAQTSANKQYAQQNGLSTYQPCNSFNAYMVYRNGFAMGTYCSLFTNNVDASFAGSVASTSGGTAYTAGSSWTYSLSPQDPGTL